MGNRYGMFKYGAEKYGASNAQTLLWSLEIDWDHDELFDGSNEAQYLSDLSTTRGREYITKPDGSGYESVTIGRADLVLNNGTRRFDPWYVYSPLYGKICTGRKVRIRVKYPGISTPADVFAGFISDIQPISGIDKKVRISLVDGVQYLQDNNASVLIHQNVSFADGIDAVLDAVEWPAIWGRDLETGIAEIPYWWADSETGKDAIASLVDANLGVFFIASDGKAKFYSRNHISQSILILDEDKLDSEVLIPQPWEVVRNNIQVMVHSMTSQALGDLWSLGEAPLIGPGESLTIFANFSFSGTECPAINVLAPVAVTDYLGNSVQNGNGTNLTGAISIATTVFSKTAKLVATNNGLTPLYLTLLKIRGNAIVETSTLTMEAKDPASQADFGKRLFSLDSPWIQNINNAMAFVNTIKAMMAFPRAFPQVRIEARPEIQFKPDLFDAATLDLPNAGISDDFRLGRIEHKWLDSNGQSVRTDWKFETFENINENVWVFPTRVGVSSIFGY